MKKYELISDIGISFITLGFSLQDIQNVLSIAIFVVQIIYILYRVIFNIYTSIKNNKLDDVDDNILDFKEELEDLLEQTQGEKDKDAHEDKQ